MLQYAPVKTLRLKIDPKNFGASDLEPAVELMREGGLVAFPTETVYGLGVDASNLEAMSRLRWLKRRPADKPFAFLVRSLAEGRSLAGELPPAVERLGKRFWPGPLTVIVPARAGQDIGIRCPGHEVPLEIVRMLGNPIAATSANISGTDPSVNGDAVAAAFDGKISCIVDCGETVLRESSTVVRFSGRGPEILRIGIITPDMLKPHVEKRILFVCSGNTCRSPMAEALLKKMLSERHDVSEGRLRKYGYYISSAGTRAEGGRRPASEAIRVMQDYDIDLTHHLTRRFSAAMARRADIILVMTTENAKQARLMAPDSVARIELLEPEGIEDPVGRGASAYRIAAGRIEKALRARLDEFAFEEN